MAKKHSSLGLAALVAAGAGAAALATKNRQEKIVEKAEVKKTTSDYRNTERGMNQEKTARVFIILTETTKLLPVRRNRKASMTSMLTW